MQRDFNSAANRACDNQFNECADLANRKAGTFEVGDCDRQNCESWDGPCHRKCQEKILTMMCV